MTTPVEPSFLEYVSEYQTLIAGFIGFTGVILAIVSQGKQSRLSSEEAAKQKSDRITSTLIEELKMMSEIFSNLVELLDEPSEESAGGKRSTAVPVIPLNIVFKSILPQLEHVEEQKFQPILKAHLTYDSYLNSLTQIGVPDPQRPGFINVRGQLNEKLLCKSTKDLREAIDNALIELGVQN